METPFVPWRPVDGAAVGARQGEDVKLACKPGSVQGDCPLGSHSSRPPVARWLQQPTREQREPRSRSPIWPCSGWGLACRSCCQERGGLLPAARPEWRAATHLAVTRTISPLPEPRELLGHRRCAFCSIFRRLAAPGR